MFYEPRKDNHGLPFNPLSACIVPRPIGWISTISAGGVPNLAPFSFFNGVGYTPPTVVFCPNGPHSEGGQKDTVLNVEATDEFVVNIATSKLRERLNISGMSFPRAVSELEEAGLATVPSTLVRPPRVAESPIHLECRHIQTVRLPSYDPDYPLHAIFGEVVGVHIDDEVIRDGRVDVMRVQPLGRLGYMDYLVVDNIFEMRNPELNNVVSPKVPKTG